MVLLGTLAAAATVFGQASAATTTGSVVHCPWRAVAQGRSYHYEGTMLGSAKCSGPFGRGHLRGKYETKLSFPTGTFRATETDHAKLSFKVGSMHGSYQISGPYSGK